MEQEQIRIPSTTLFLGSDFFALSILPSSIRLTLKLKRQGRLMQCLYRVDPVPPGNAARRVLSDLVETENCRI